MQIIISTPVGEQTIALNGEDEFMTITVDGRELIAIFADSGAGWYPHGDGGETFGDWTALQPRDLPEATTEIPRKDI